MTNSSSGFKLSHAKRKVLGVKKDRTGRLHRERHNKSSMPEYLIKELVLSAKPSISQKYIVRSPNRRDKLNKWSSIEEHMKSLSMQFPERRSAWAQYSFYGIPDSINNLKMIQNNFKSSSWRNRINANWFTRTAVDHSFADKVRSNWVSQNSVSNTRESLSKSKQIKKIVSWEVDMWTNKVSNGQLWRKTRALQP
jgi:hypothetical protein